MTGAQALFSRSQNFEFTGGDLLGRKTKPTGLKLLEGTARPDRINDEEPVYSSGGIVRPDEWLTEDEQQYWAHFAPKVISANVMTEADILALVQLCKETATYMRACKQIELDGDVLVGAGGEMKRNPWVIIRKQSFEASAKHMASFGLTPSDRTRIRAPRDGQKPQGNKFAGVRES